MTADIRRPAASLPRYGRPLMWGSAAALLLAPAVAMRFTAEVRWGPGDFAVFGLLLALLCGGVELALRRAPGLAARAAAGIALAGVFLLVWANLAVGLIGSEGPPANLMYAAVIAIGASGTLAVRFRPAGMAWVMAAMALTQVLAAGIAAAMGWGRPFAATALFAAVWLASALLFRKAARDG